MIYINYYNEIKNELINNEVKRRIKNYSINKSDLNTYYNVGKILYEADKHYGEGIIKEYSKRLTKELGKGYTETNLKYFRQFYLFSKRHTVCDELTWSHYRILLSISNENKIEYYKTISIRQNLSVRQLQEKIKSNEYERLSIETKNKLLNNDNIETRDIIPDPIIIKSNRNTEIINEKILHSLILEDIESFMNSLGAGYSFIGSEYKIKLDNRYNYIDLLLLLFNYECNSFVVVELKVCELKKEHVGQIEVYMNYIDNNLRSINHNKTIGLIICKENNNYVIKYCSDKSIIFRKYSILNINKMK